MAVPKKKTARSKSKVRHTAFVKKQQKKLLDRTKLVPCKNCGESKLSHTVCGSCGFFAGKEIMPKKEAQVTKVQA